MDKTNITFEDIYSNLMTKLGADQRFKNIGSATTFGMFGETIAASTDMALFNQQRLLEEGFFKTARNDSSYIKLVKNFGYMPKRAIPAQADLAIVLKGPFPQEFKDVTTPISITVSNDMFDLSFNKLPFRLTESYTYTLTDEDKKHCTETTWRKVLRSCADDTDTSHKLYASVDAPKSKAISCYQGELKTVVFHGEDYIEKFNNEQCAQYYDINDITFSNWYGNRDPFAVNSDGVYSPANGITTVEISTNDVPSTSRTITSDTAAFCEIEDHSIMLNKNLLDENEDGNSNNKNICLVETLEDKTIRISFTKLKYLATSGLENVKDKNGNLIPQNLIVQYLSTKGAKGNIADIRDGKLTNKAKLSMMINGKLFDVTNNIELIFRNDLTGGEDFETKQEMKDSALSYYASMMQLVSKRDFINYLSDLYKPIDVTNALVFGQKELDIAANERAFTKNADTSDVISLNQNNVFYCLTSNLYAKKPNSSEWAPKNILLKHDGVEPFEFDGFIPEDVNNPCTLYADEYPEHIVDFAKFIVSPNAFYTYYQKTIPEDDNGTKQFLANIQSINRDMKPMILSNTILYSLPPFMQYFDLVGDVKVKSSVTDLEAFKLKLNNTLYMYLNEHMNETREIYKSDLAKLLLSVDGVETADIDLKVSSLVSPIFKDFTWNQDISSDNGVRVIGNYGINSNIKPDDLGIQINELILPNRDSNYVPITGDTLRCTHATIELVLKGSNGNDDIKIDATAQCKLTSIDSLFVKVILNDVIIKDYDINKLEKLYTDTSLINADIERYEPASRCKLYNVQVVSLKLTLNTLYNYWSTSKFLDDERYITGTAEANGGLKSEYNLYQADLEDAQYISIDAIKKLAEKPGANWDDPETLKLVYSTVQGFLNYWLYNLAETNQADRVIDLPYSVYSYKTLTRLESIKRLGNIISDDKHTLSEHSFWYYFVPELIGAFYTPDWCTSKGININRTTAQNDNELIREDTNIDSNNWTAASKLIMDIYKLLKPAITDNILDDNNNIVNYSTDQDIPVVRSCIDISYINN